MDKKQIIEVALELAKIAKRFDDAKPEQKVLKDKVTELKNLVTEPLHVNGVPPSDEELHAAWTGLIGKVDAEKARDKDPDAPVTGLLDDGA